MPTLTNGTRLGPYEILAPIGAGGMGEVYRAVDTRLDRVVAVKVLAAGLANDVTSRERFEREAKTISSLNHPNICVLHDIGRAEPSGSNERAVDYLVMEYLEGETLSARLSESAKRLTVDEVLEIAIPVAAALDCAHRQGVIHRDLKPGNVMLTKDTVKLLDFGLARLSQPAGDRKDTIGQGLVTLADLSLPTMSSPLTVKGTILGTLQYMAPEQLEGKEVDGRADIFAFGGMLYEMLTGKRPFEGKSQASLIGAILDHHPPPVSTLRPLSPPIIDDLVARCLEKDREDRWQTARDLKRQLEWIAKSLVTSTTVLTGAVVRSRKTNRALTIAAASLAGVVVLGGAVAWAVWPRPSRPPVPARFAITLPEGQQFTRAGRHVLTLSPDGSRLVYISNQQLYSRAMSELVATVIPGSEGSDPSEPVFSPDGQWVAFWSSNELKKIPIGGGTPITLAPAINPNGASWSGDRILLGQANRVVEVPANGGAPRVVLAVDEKASERVQSPQLIAGGRAVLFTLRVGSASWDESSIVVHDLSTGQRKTLVRGGTDAHVVPTGHLVYVRSATLFAMPFDEKALDVIGTPVQLDRGIQQAATAASGAAQWVWADNGTVAFIPGEGETGDRLLMWFSRDGKIEPTAAPPRPITFNTSGLRIAPDGTRVALSVETDPSGGGSAAFLPATIASDIWIWDIRRNTVTRLTVNGKATSPVWTPDSQRLCYRAGTDILCQAADGSGAATTLATYKELDAVKSFSPDGRQLLWTAAVGKTNDIFVTATDASFTTRPLIGTRFTENSPAISPDGRWVAYSSDESGRTEIYVRPFPEVDRGRWQVSTEGGLEPRWARDGRTLFYFTGGGPVPRVLWSAAVTPGPRFTTEPPRVLARLARDTSSAYDVATDGRILFHLSATSTVARPQQLSQIVVVQHWFDELNARVPRSAR